MSSEIFQTYRHSGKFGFHGPVLAILVAAIAALPLGYLYAYVIKWIPFVYVNFLATIGYGFLFGFLGAWLMKAARVRNTAIAAITGLLMGSLALYGAWVGHIHATFQGAPIFCMPHEVVGVMRQLYEEGSWGLHGSPVTGIPLAIVWFAEAAMIIGITAAVCASTVSRTPYCEISQCWLDQSRKIDTLATFSDPAQLSAFRAGDLGPLLQAKPREPQAGAWTRILLKHSPRCETFHTVRLQNIHITVDKEGKSKENVKDITGDLVLPAAMFPLISKFEDFKPAPLAPPPAGSAPEPAA